MKFVQVFSGAALLGVIAAVILSGGDAAPVAVAAPPAQVVYSYTLYMPIIQKGDLGNQEQAPARFLTACSDDPARGALYRTLVSGTIAIMNPLAEWANDGCECGLDRARAQGRAFGGVIGLGVAIVGRIFTTLANIVEYAMNMIFQFIGLVSAPMEGMDITCDDDAEGFCAGLAAIVAIDDMAGGIITTIVVLLVSILTIYLVLYIIGEVRQMIQPGSGED